MLIILVNLIIAALLSSLMVGIASPMITFSKSLMAGFSFIHGVLAGGLLATYLYYVLDLTVPPPEVITLLYVIAIAFLVGELIERGYSTDAASAISTSVSAMFSVLFAFLSGPYASRAWAIVIGTSVIVAPKDIILLTVFLVLLVIIQVLFKKELMYISFDPEGAYTLGYAVRFYRYIIYISIALVVVALTYTLGIIIAHILIATPGALALSISRKRYLQISILIALVISLAGYILAYVMGTPPSVGVGLMASGVLIVGELFKRRGIKSTQ